MAVDGTWASPLPHAASATVRLDETQLHAEENHHYVRSWRPAVGLLLAINEGRGKPPSLISFFTPPASPSSSSPHRLAAVSWRQRRGSRQRRRGRLARRGPARHRLRGAWPPPQARRDPCCGSSGGGRTPLGTGAVLGGRSGASSHGGGRSRRSSPCAKGRRVVVARPPWSCFHLAEVLPEFVVWS